MIDWNGKLEAVHEDGRVVLVALARPEPDYQGHYQLDEYLERDAGGYFNVDGTPFTRGLGWTIRNRASFPAPTLTPMEFGPEIKVDGKRPEWLKDDEKFGWKRVTGTWTAFSDWTATERSLNWSEVQSIRLPANHPHYATPTPDERAVAPELVARLVAVVKEQVYAHRNVTNPAPSLIEARAILAALEPVDRAEAKRLAGIWEIDEEAAYQILARGRQLEKEGK